jgi:hypothetical protein
MKQNGDRFMTGIFCDDIRHEMGNKLSFMGCYQSELLVPSMPTVLPKLCIYASAATPTNTPFKSLILRVVQDDENELARIEIPAEGIEEAAKIQDETSTRKTVSTAIVFSPFVVDKPSSLRLMATTEEGEIVGPRLLIKLHPTLAAETPAPAKEMKSAKRRVGTKKPAAKKAAAKA